MDKQRNNLLAYEYLCHIGEAKEWIEDCLQDEIDPIIKLEESMRNGIVLAKLADWFAPGIVRKIFQVHIHTSFKRIVVIAWNFNPLMPQGHQITISTFWQYQLFFRGTQSSQIAANLLVWTDWFVRKEEHSKSHLLHSCSQVKRRYSPLFVFDHPLISRATSHLLSRRNLAPNIKNLLGQLQFTSKFLWWLAW